MMTYAPKGTYDFEAMTWTEYKAFDPTKGWTEEKCDLYDETIYNLYNDRIPTDEEIEKVAKDFNIPYDYVENEGWLFVED